MASEALEGGVSGQQAVLFRLETLPEYSSEDGLRTDQMGALARPRGPRGPVLFAADDHLQRGRSVETSVYESPLKNLT